MRTFNKKFISLSLTMALLSGCGASSNPADPGMMPPPGMNGMQPGGMQPLDQMGAPPMDQFGQPLDGPVDEFGAEGGFEDEFADDGAGDELTDDAPPAGDFNPEDTSSDLSSGDSSIAPPSEPLMGGAPEPEEKPSLLQKATAIAGPVIGKIKGAAGPALQAIKGAAGPLIGKLTSVFKGGGGEGESGSSSKAVSFGNPNGFGSANLVTVSGQLQVQTSGLSKFFNSKPNKEIWVRVELDGFVRESMTDSEGTFNVQFKQLNLASGEKKATVSLSKLNTKSLSSSPVEVSFTIN